MEANEDQGLKIKTNIANLLKGIESKMNIVISTRQLINEEGYFDKNKNDIIMNMFNIEDNLRQTCEVMHQCLCYFDKIHTGKIRENKESSNIEMTIENDTKTIIKHDNKVLSNSCHLNENNEIVRRELETSVNMTISNDTLLKMNQQLLHGIEGGERIKRIKPKLNFTYNSDQELLNIIQNDFILKTQPNDHEINKEMLLLKTQPNDITDLNITSYHPYHNQLTEQSNHQYIPKAQGIPMPTQPVKNPTNQPEHSYDLSSRMDRNEFNSTQEPVYSTIVKEEEEETINHYMNDKMNEPQPLSYKISPIKNETQQSFPPQQQYRHHNRSFSQQNNEHHFQQQQEIEDNTLNELIMQNNGTLEPDMNPIDTASKIKSKATKVAQLVTLFNNNQDLFEMISQLFETESIIDLLLSDEVDESLINSIFVSIEEIERLRMIDEYNEQAQKKQPQLKFHSQHHSPPIPKTIEQSLALKYPKSSKTILGYDYNNNNNDKPPIRSPKKYTSNKATPRTKPVGLNNGSNEKKERKRMKINLISHNNGKGHKQSIS